MLKLMKKHQTYIVFLELFKVVNKPWNSENEFEYDCLEFCTRV